ncbi:sulfotransferase family protein [Streptomyces sp. NPDC006739]|uniref:sulfotransferase family protein n=1 Tax=Streptomyces sp. NPDC006739 TaxID=3364763 RepID=UPI0036BACA51
MNGPTEWPAPDPATATAPVFIVGSPRSSTNALAYALATHTALWTSGESRFLAELFGHDRVDWVYDRAYRSPGQHWLAMQGVTREEFLRSLGAGIDALFRSRTDGRRWIDHTPPYVFIADILADMFPTAHFIHIIRDGRRVVDSMINFGKRPDAHDGEGVELPLWATDFNEACLTWASSVRAGLEFCSRFPGRARTVVSEDLTARPEAEFAMLLRFLGLPYEPGPAQWLSTHRINSSYQASDRGRTAADQNGWHTWSAAQQRIFDQYAAQLLTLHGIAR